MYTLASLALLLVLGTAFFWIAWRQRAFGPIGDALFAPIVARESRDPHTARRAQAVHALERIAVEKSDLLQIQESDQRFYVRPDWTDRVRHLYLMSRAARLFVFSPYKSERLFGRLLRWIASTDRLRWFSGVDSSEIIPTSTTVAISESWRSFITAYDQGDVELALSALSSLIFALDVGSPPGEPSADARQEAYGPCISSMVFATRAFLGPDSQVAPFRSSVRDLQRTSGEIGDQYGYLLAFIIQRYMRTFNIWWAECAAHGASMHIRRAFLLVNDLVGCLLQGSTTTTYYHLLTALLSDLSIEPTRPPRVTIPLEPFVAAENPPPPSLTQTREEWHAWVAEFAAEAASGRSFGDDVLEPRLLRPDVVHQVTATAEAWLEMEFRAFPPRFIRR
jgi:hypothetical protein